MPTYFGLALGSPYRQVKTEEVPDQPKSQYHTPITHKHSLCFSIQTSAESMYSP